ncbi:thiol reductant ABC exporter subunit CydC [Sanguibacter antarcticus]|uniref:ATP-binding cassette subfamily C protein CydC n=1 Tax=Sanguibacter antarcticus TaxID=372484 RepID=A0A2A9E1A8_9MICO|nr:thiol reductant ABC exporter subunit CydC [Sanguibacter antarcticus]PFG32728.1 ATP-binding cassette subfamily C protein CydC [Sanguibacter antarcticus]
MRRDPLWRAVALLGVSKRRAAGAVLLGVLALGSAIALAAVSAWLIARASQMPPVLTLSVATVAVRFFGISRGVLRYLERLASHTIALSGMSTLRTRIYESLSVGRLESVASLRRGDLLARVGADVDSVGDVVVRGLFPSAVAAVLAVASTVLVGALHPGAALALAACLVLAGVVAPWFAAVGARTTEVDGSAARSDMAALAQEIVDDASVLTVSGHLDERLASLHTADQRLAASTDRGARTSGAASALGTFAVGAAVLGALLLAVPAVAAGTLAPVALAVVVLTPLAAFEAVQALPAAAIQISRSRQAAIRVLALLDSAGTPSALQAASAPETDPGGTVEHHPSEGHLVASGLVCGWPDRAPVVSGLDLEVRPGRAVAIVGPSGTGKTTVLMTLAGLLPPVAGELVLDGCDVGTLPRPTVAATVVLTTEDAHVFDTSVLENLRVARGSTTEDEAAAALALAGLEAWFTALPDGLHTQLGPDARTVSGGERRRLLVARALCSAAPLLLVDEPAEHLDPTTADTLVTDLLALRDRPDARGLIIATHRLSALRTVDEVIFFETGGILARGTHDALLETCTAYREAVEAEATPELVEAPPTPVQHPTTT